MPFYSLNAILKEEEEAVGVEVVAEVRLLEDQAVMVEDHLVQEYFLYLVFLVMEIKPTQLTLLIIPMVQHIIQQSNMRIHHSHGLVQFFLQYLHYLDSEHLLPERTEINKSKELWLNMKTEINQCALCQKIKEIEQ